MHTSLGMKPCQCGQQPRLVASAEPLRFYTCHHLSCWETRGLDHPKGRDGNAHNSHSQQPIVARVEPADAEQAVVFRVSLCVREALQLVFPVCADQARASTEHALRDEQVWAGSSFWHQR